MIRRQPARKKRKVNDSARVRGRNERPQQGMKREEEEEKEEEEEMAEVII